MKVKSLLRLVLGVFFAILFLWLIIRQINLDEFRQAFDNVDAKWIIAALLAFAIGYSCRIERWRLMLERDNPSLKWRSCAGPLLASFAVNNVLPFRTGDLLRSFAFNRALGTNSSVVIATLFVERLLDLLMVLVLLGLALAIFNMDTTRFTGIGGAMLTAGSLAILTVLFFPGWFSPVVLAIVRLGFRLSPRLGQKLLNEINKSLVTLQCLAKGHTMIKLVFWSMMAWLAEGCVFWFAALALSSITAPLAGWLALSIGTLATLIPSTPGYIGTFDFFTVRAMTALGNTAAAAAVYALLVHLLLWFPPVLVGGLYLLLHPAKSITKLKVF